MFTRIRTIMLTLYPYISMLLPVIAVAGMVGTYSAYETYKNVSFWGELFSWLHAMYPLIALTVFPPIIIGLYVISILCPIFNLRATIKGKYTAHETAKMNIAVKGWQIPIYIINFILGIIGVCMSVWGFPVLIIVVVIDFLSIISSGVNAVCCSIMLYKEGYIPLSRAIIFGICSFIYCIDVAVAIYYFIKTKPKAITNTEANVV